MKNSMKLLAMALLVAFGTAQTVHAIDYEHSFGARVGGFNGASYKGFVLGLGNLALQVDFGVRVSALGPSFTFTSKDDFGHSEKWKVKLDPSLFYYTIEANPGVVYQNEIAEFRAGTLNWFAGGAVSIGVLRCDAARDIIIASIGHTTGQFGFKLGANVLGGIEFVMEDAPLAFDFDFRPGYGLGIWYSGDEHNRIHTFMSFFDWALAASVRVAL